MQVLIAYLAIVFIPLLCTTVLFASKFSATAVFLYLCTTFLAARSFHLAAFTGPGFVNFTDAEHIPANLKIEENWCRLCETYKPARAHHCRKCKRCVKRMDHHCFWIGNCVGFFNQANFIRLIGYAFLLCVETMALLVSFLLAVFRNEGVELTVMQIILSSIVVVILCPLITILGFLNFNQMVMLAGNLTTIEDLEIKDDKEMGLHPTNFYDVGVKRNIEQVLGRGMWGWGFPKEAVEGNGMDFDASNSLGL